MADLLGWLGKEVGAPIQRDVLRPINNAVVQPFYHNAVLPAANTAAAAGAGIGGLARVGAGAITHNPIAEQNAINQTNQAINNRLALNRAFLTAGQAQQGGTALIKPVLHGAGAIAPYAVGGLGGGIIKPALAFGGVNAASTALQGDLKAKDLAKSFALGALPVGAGKAIGVGVRGTPAVARTVQKYDQAQNQVGAVGKNVKLSPDDIKSLQKQGFDQQTINKMAGPQGEKVAAPQVPTRTAGSPKIPKPQGNIIPQVSAEGKITSLTSPMNRLPKLGQGGQGALQVMRDKEIGARVHTQQLADIAKPFFNLSKDQQATAIKVHKGEFTTKDPAVQAAADSLRKMFPEVERRRIAAGIKAGSQGPNYFPQSYPREWFKNPKSINKAAQQLVANGKAPDLETAVAKLNRIKVEGSVNPEVYGHFKQRTTDIPGIENAQTVTNYIRGASDAIASAEHFGPKNRILLGHVATAIKNGEDATALRGIVSNYLHPNRPGTGALNTTLNAYQKGLRVLQLPRAAISHGPQGIANTASDIGYKNYFKAMGQKINMSSEDKRFLNANGFRSEKVAPPEGLAGKATAPGLGHLLQFHRDVAALGGRNMALHAAEAGDAAALKGMAISGRLVKGADGKINLTEAQQAQAGHFEANKSIGSSSRLESPAWTQSQGGKLIGMYRKMYTFKQAERIGNWLTEARNGNPGPLIKYLAIGVPVSGLAVAAAKDEIKNPGSNPVKDKGKLTLDTLHNSGVGSIGYGTADSAINAATHNYGNDSRWSNAANFVSPGLGFAVQTGQNTSKASHGNPAPLIREGLRLSPVGGTALANKVAPPTPFIKADNSGSTGTPQQKNANAKTELKALGNSPNLGNGYSLQQLSNGKYAYTLDGDTSVHQASSLSAARLAVAEAGFKDSSGSYKVVGDKVLRKAADGTVSAISKDSFDYKIGTATLTSQKLAGNVNGWLATASSQLSLIDKQLQDPNIDPLDRLTLQNDAGNLQSNIDKYTGYGGFTKPKAAKKATLAVSSFKTASSAKAITRPKGVSIRAPKTPSFKAPKTTRLSVSRIPVVASRRKA